MTPRAPVRRAISLLALAAGLAMLVWQVRQTGVSEIVRGFASVGAWGAAAIMVLSWLRFGARSTGWTALIAGETPPGRALAAVVAGDAAGNLTPLSMLVSEPAKAALLGWAVPSVGTAQALAALAAETFFFGVSVAIYSILGAAALLIAYDIDAPIRIAGLITLAAMTTVLIVAAWMVLKKPTVAGGVLARVPVPFVRAFAERVRSFERTAYATTTRPGARVGVVIAAASFFHVLSFAEMWLTLWLLTGDSLLAAAFVLDAVGRLVNAVFKMIPLQLGILQVGSELVARAIGLAPGTGVLVSLIRTARMLVWTGIGLVILGRHGLRSS
ncbi:MAG TPA: lysylphosphatidylglycerol synthase domain-containing protein [Vicinamibacterales bacterium]|nr:lysylphosphatidylglycerol synthase domain-containing protein [Vicinamibacterales bacterium]